MPRGAQAVVVDITALGRRAAALPLEEAGTQDFANFGGQAREILTTHWQRGDFNDLVNNAGVGVHTSLMETTEAPFDALVNVSTGLIRFALPGFAAYAAMKVTVGVLTRCGAKELGPRGIAVNGVAPGAIETDFGGDAVRDKAQMNAFVASQTNPGRVGQPDEIGGVIAALLSEPIRWINAQRIEASGVMFF
jgi:short-subunit dehydrogenase